jgi:hypothetical protein
MPNSRHETLQDRSLLRNMLSLFEKHPIPANNTHSYLHSVYATRPNVSPASLCCAVGFDIVVLLLSIYILFRAPCLLYRVRSIYEEVMWWRKIRFRDFDGFGCFEFPEYEKVVSDMPSLCVCTYMYICTYVRTYVL